MELLDNAMSPYAFKVRLALYEKGVKFDKREIRAHADRDSLLRINPRAEVPALRDGETLVYDSNVICEYLDDRLAPSLLPDDAAGRARCRQLEKVADTALDAAVFVLGVMRTFRPDLVERFPAALRQATDVLQRHHASLAGELGEQDFFLGRSLTRADVAIVPHLIFAAFFGHGVDAERHPGLAGWFARMNERPSVQRTTQEALDTYTAWQADPDPLFSRNRLHWRSDRIEAALRCGLGPWLHEELAADRAFLPPAP